MMLRSADAWYRRQRRISARMLVELRRRWGRAAPAGFEQWYAAHAGELASVVTAAQIEATVDAEMFVDAVLAEQGYRTTPSVQVATSALVGVAGDGHDLRWALHKAVVAGGERALAGAEPYQAWKTARDTLMVVAHTALADVARTAVGVGIATRPRVAWTRMLNPPSCARCVILAGRVYRWSTGFARHPGCDCRHIPAPEGRAGDLTVNPDAYFDSLTADQQDALLGRAGAQAVRDGADMAQVVNARKGTYTAQAYGRELLATREGTTRRGAAHSAMRTHGLLGGEEKAGRYMRARSPRLMPETIYQIAADQNEAIRLLERHGYLTTRGPTGRAVPAPRARPLAAGVRPPLKGGGSGKPPAGPPKQPTTFAGRPNPEKWDDEGRYIGRVVGADTIPFRHHDFLIDDGDAYVLLNGDGAPLGHGHHAYDDMTPGKTKFGPGVGVDEARAWMEGVRDNPTHAVVRTTGAVELHGQHTGVHGFIVADPEHGGKPVLNGHPLFGEAVTYLDHAGRRHDRRLPPRT